MAARARVGGGFLALAVLFSAVGVLGSTKPASAAFALPRYVRSIGGDGVPALYAWGVQYDPVSDEVVVGDYLNFQLRRYDTEGNLLSSFYRSGHQGQPYSIAVEPDGDIIVPEIRDSGQRSWFAKYDAAGNFKAAFRITSAIQHYHAWIATDAQGRLYVSDSHYTATSGNPNRIMRFTVSDTGAVSGATVLRSSYGTGPGQIGRAYGIDVDAAGNIWLTDSMNGVLHKYSATGAWVADYGQGLFSNDIRSVVVDDARGFVYVADASASKIFKFSTGGTLLGSWGSEGPGPGRFGGGPRQLTVTPDGRVWAADYGNFRVNVYDPDGNFLFDLPAPARGAKPGHLSQPRDVDVSSLTGDVWVADGWNQRIQKFAPDGTFLATWGHRSGAPPYGMNYPRSIGIDPATGNVWVANERGHYIRVFDPTMETVLFQIGSPENDNTATGNLRWPVDIEFWNGRAVVGDRVSERVKVFDAATGTQLASITRANHGVAVNPANGDIYAIDPGTDRVYQYNQAGSLIRQWGSTGQGDGQFNFPWDAVVHGDRVYVADSDLSRIQVFTLTGTFEGKWGSYNSGPYDFKNASGLAVDDATGHLYVADAGNNRIQVYDLTTPRVAYESGRPTVSITSPVSGAVLGSAGQFVVSGAATDNVAVATVSVAVQDTTTGRWWRSATATWDETKSYGIAAWRGEDRRAVAWQFPVNGLEPGGAYLVEARVVDHWNNASAANPTATFAVLADFDDEADPVTTVAVPGGGQQFLANLPIVFGGDASDDVGVETVRVAIGRGGEWLGPDGTFGPTFTWYAPATLATPGSPATAWSFTAPGLAPGPHSVMAQAVDLAGKLDLARPVVPFTVLPPDTAGPTGELVAPAPGGTVPHPGGPLPISGTVADAHAVTAVDVAIKDTVADQWLRPDGTWGTFAYLPAALDDPGAAASDWSFLLAGVQERRYGIQARATDPSGNVNVFRPYTTFTVVPAGPVDAGPPTGSLSAPTPNSTVPFGTVVLTGTAADDLMVSAVDVGVKNVSTNRWLQPDGTWGAAFAWVPAVLDAPGQPATGWSYVIDPPNAGTFGVQARARDGAGNTASIRSYVTFTVLSA